MMADCLAGLGHHAHLGVHVWDTSDPDIVLQFFKDR